MGLLVIYLVVDYISQNKRPILSGKVDFPLCLAPMVGLSHVATRLMMREYLPEGVYTLWPTEMLSSRRLPKEDLSKTPETLRGADEIGLSPQILGHEESFIEPSVKKLIDWGAEAIDINMGCPVQKALKHNYGVALMGDANYAAEVVHMTVKNSSVPVSVKLRAGHQADEAYLLNFVKGLSEAGASWICLHPRTTEQKRRGSADWRQIKNLREQVSIPIIGNGDVQTLEDVLQMLEQTDCDSVMVGRALTARPWLLWQLGEKLGLKAPPNKSGRAPSTAFEEGAEYGRSLKRLLELMQEYFISESLVIRKFRFYVRTSCVWLTFGNELYSCVTKATTVDETFKALEAFFDQPVSMSQKTELRQ